jgi:hypothetical protein
MIIAQVFYEYKYPYGLQDGAILGHFRGFGCVYGCFDGGYVRIWDRGCWGSGSALRWVVVGGWLARGGILRFAQNDKEYGSGGRSRGLASWACLWCPYGAWDRSCGLSWAAFSGWLLGVGW